MTAHYDGEWAIALTSAGRERGGAAAPWGVWGVGAFYSQFPRYID